MSYSVTSQEENHQKHLVGNCSYFMEKKYNWLQEYITAEELNGKPFTPGVYNTTDLKHLALIGPIDCEWKDIGHYSHSPETIGLRQLFQTDFFCLLSGLYI